MNFEEAKKIAKQEESKKKIKYDIALETKDAYIFGSTNNPVDNIDRSTVVMKDGTKTNMTKYEKKGDYKIVAKKVI